MALTLQCLSRAVCKQPVLAATPRTLGAVTPKTPALSPGASPVAHFSPFVGASPFASRSPFFGDLSSATPTAKNLAEAWQPASQSVDAFLARARASTAVQQELAAEARPAAEAARRLFLDRRGCDCPSPDGSLTDRAGSVLLGHGTRTEAKTLGAAVADPVTPPCTQQEQAVVGPSLPVLLGRPAPAQTAAPSELGALIRELNSEHAAQRAQQAFMTRKQCIEGRTAVEATANAPAQPVLLGGAKQPEHAPVLQAVSRSVRFELGPMEAAREAQQVAWARQQCIEGRSHIMVP